MIYIFVITFLVLQILVDRTWTLNVRTALFTTTDLAKKKWSKRDVALLKARMYLQDLIPPMEVSQHPDYVSFLIRYIEDCYASVNREAFDPEMETILKDAVSDVLGGYLKMVALPVTKYVYYCGSMPTREALQLFKYYNDIKRHLGTRGASWSDQIPNINKTMTRGTRSNLLLLKLNNPCQHLLNLRNGRQSLAMPMPSIDWNTRMMFVPLTDHPIVDLRSPHVEPVLLKFHQAATACERSISPYQHRFQNSFQNWVNQAVVPHLTDEDLYTAFQGILSLIDNVDTTLNYEENSNIFTKHFNVSTTSRIVAIIFILEVLFCVPTLVYLRKNKRGSSTRNSLNKKPRKFRSELNLVRKHSKKGSGKKTSIVNSISYKKTSKANFMSTMSGTQCSYTSITDVATMTDEAPMKKGSNRNKKVQPSSLHLPLYKNTESVNDSLNQHQAQVSSSVLAPQATSTFSARNINTPSTNGASNDTGETNTLSTVRRRKSAFNMVRESKRFRKRGESSPNVDLNSSETDTQCTFHTLGNVEKVRYKSKNSSIAKDLILDICKDAQLEGAVTQDRNPNKVDFSSPNISISLRNAKIGETRDNQSNVSNMKKTKILRVLNKVRMLENQYRSNAEGTRERTQQTNIEMPRQVIHKYTPIVEKVKDEEEKARTVIHKYTPIVEKVKDEEEKARTGRKPSRIPKKLNPNADKNASSRRTPSPARPKLRIRSLIPKKTRAQDDAAIRPAPAQNPKLNDTL